MLNESWKAVTKISDPAQYMSVAATWIELPLKFLTMREVSVMLRDVVKHVNVDRAFERLQNELQSIIVRCVARVAWARTWTRRGVRCVCVLTHGWRVDSWRTTR